MLRITGGRVYDPANNINGVIQDICLDNGKVVGTITNQSDKVLEKPAVVLGSSAQVVGGDLQPGQSAQIDLKLEQNPFAVAQLSERIVGNAFFVFSSRDCFAAVAINVGGG